ncbi:MAG TPA: hypothetical protein VL547_05740, partial [Dinghuibacter sp.]|uniref:hypothetical protein n=1 Tax=Dinghuibacter sp. TaxID=2024697 RepID=UPI002BB04C49
MIRYPNLVPECNVDTVFVEAIGYKGPSHASSITGVCSVLEKWRGPGKVIGFIDNDKKKPQYFYKFEKIQEFNRVSIYKHFKKEQYLVVVDPAMDKFIYDLGKGLGLRFSETYRLPHEFSPFLALTKKNAILKNRDFRNLLNTIIQKNPAEIQF